MALVVLDTDVASLAFRGRLTSGLSAALTGQTWCLTFVTVGEMTQWAHLRNWSQRSRGTLTAWLDAFVQINSTVEIARLWGSLSAAGRLRGRSTPVNDTWIAACCLTEGLPLATLNTKDYADFAAHHGLHLLGD